jgi:glycogen synthase
VNILLFPSAYFPSLGGVEEMTRHTARQLMKLGHNVGVVTNRWPRDLAKREIVDDVVVFRPALRTSGAGWKSNLSYLLTSAMTTKQVKDLVTKFRADVIHVHCVWPGVRYALDVAKAFGLPVVVTLHGELTMDATGLYQKSRYARDMLRRALAESRRVTAVSAHTLLEAKAFAGDSLMSNAIVIPNGVDTEEFEHQQPYFHPRPFVLAMGRLVEQKGFDLLLRAWKALRLEGIDLLIAGEGSQRTALEELSRSLAIDDSVVLLGRANRKTVAALYAGCMCFVLPSRQEPFGIVLLEAMASGAPIVATHVGGVAEVVEDDVSAVLVQASVDGLKVGLRRILTNDVLRRRLALEGRERVKRFTWSAITRKYVEIYQSVVRSSAGTRG